MSGQIKDGRQAGRRSSRGWRGFVSLDGLLTACGSSLFRVV